MKSIYIEHDFNQILNLRKYEVASKSLQKAIEIVDRYIKTEKDNLNVAINQHIDLFSIFDIKQIYKLILPNKSKVEIEVIDISFGFSLSLKNELIYTVLELEYTKRGARKKFLIKKYYPHSMMQKSEITQITCSSHYKNPRNI